MELIALYEELGGYRAVAALLGCDYPPVCSTRSSISPTKSSVTRDRRNAGANWPASPAACTYRLTVLADHGAAVDAVGARGGL